MIARFLAGAAAALCVAGAALSAPTIAEMRWQRRVLLVAAPAPGDPRLAVQKRILAEWRQAGADRDVSLVQVTGRAVAGSGDSAATLRHRYSLAPGGFQALLIGKDGHVALRSARPIDAGTLQGTIDAMPMRRAGER